MIPDDLPRMEAALLAEISYLESALAALKPGARRPHLTPELEARRHALLDRHLGFVPKQPVPELL